MKKILLVVLAVAASSASFAWHCPPPPPPHHHSDGWGRGGCNFWPGFVGGLAAGLVTSAVRSDAPTVIYPQTTVVQQPVVVTQPVVVQQPVTTVVAQPVVTTVAPRQVWVEGRYIDTVQPNGTILRTWQPGHYETR